MSKVLESLRKDVEERISAYNAAILQKADFAKINRIEGEVRDAEAAYNDQQMKEVFAECGKQQYPILAAVKRYDYPILSHKIIREDGLITGMALTEDRTKQIDLVKLCKALSISHLWEYKVEELGNLLCMRAAKELGWSDAQVKQIEKLYYRSAISRDEAKLGVVPTSNTQICRLIQQVIDAVLPVDPETGKSQYRCNSHDVAYLLMCYTKRNGKQKLTIEVAKNTYVHRLVMDVMHRIACGLWYDLKYQQIRKDDEGKKAEPQAAQKPEKAAVTEEMSIPRPKKAAAPAEAPAAEVLSSELDELPAIDEVPADEVSCR